MGTPCQWIKSDAYVLIGIVQNPVFGNCRFAVFFTDHLPGAVERIEAKRKIDGSCFFELLVQSISIQQGYITLLNTAIDELFLQVLMNFLSFGDK